MHSDSGDSRPVIGHLTTATGKVFAISPDGSKRVLEVGSVLYLHERVFTGQGVAATITLINNQLLELDDTARLVLVNSMLDSPGDEDIDPEILEIQRAILEGEDPTRIARASAAGESAESSQSAGLFIVNLLEGASDLDNSDTLIASSLTLTSGDVRGVTVSEDGNSLTVDPDAYTFLAASETEVISYSCQVTDGNGGSVTQEASITIQGNNDAPVDHEIEDTITLNITVTDNNGAQYSESITLTVNDVNEQPVSADSTSTLQEDTPYIFSLDDFPFTDPDTGNTLQSLQITTLPSAGQLLYNGLDATVDLEISRTDILLGRLKFEPGDHEYGNNYAAFNYKVSDGELFSEQAAFTFNVTSVNDAPDVNSAVSSSAEQNDSPITVNLLQHSSDVDTGDSLNIANLSLTSGNDSGISPSGNSLNVEPTAYSYQVPAEAFEDLDGDTLDYTATLSDGSPLPDWLSFDTSSRTFSGTPDDADLTNLVVKVRVSDGSLHSDRTFTVYLTDVNEAATAQNETVSTTEDVNYTFTASDFNFTDQDEGDALSQVRIETLPANGELLLKGSAVAQGDDITAADIAAGNLVFSPEQDANGTAYDSFTFKVADSDSVLSTSSYTMTIDVTADNDTPVISAALTDSVNEDFQSGDSVWLVKTDGGYGKGVKVEISDNENGTLNIKVIEAKYESLGIWNTLGDEQRSTYFESAGTTQTVATSNSEGGYGISEVAINGGPTVSGFVDTVTGKTLNPFHTAENGLDGVVVGSVAATDIEGDSLTYSLSNDAGGRFSIDSSTGQITVADASLLDYETATSHTITVAVTDDDLTSTRDYVINLSDTNDAPIALNDSNTGEATAEGSAITGAASVLANDTDAENDTLSVVDVNGTTVSGSTNIAGLFGDLTIGTDGNWTCTPATLDLTTNLVGQWAFDGNTIDSAPGDAVTDTGTLSGSATASGTGLSGNSLNLTASGDAYLLNDSSEITGARVTDRTINLSFRIDASNDLSNRQVLFDEGGKTRGLNAYIDNGKLYIGGQDTSIGWEDTWYSIDVPSDNDYHNISLVLGNNQLTAYLDGNRLTDVAKDVSTGTIEISTSHDELAFGARLGDMGFHDGVHDDSSANAVSGSFIGDIDEARVYNRALSDQEIQALNYEFKALTLQDVFTYTVSDNDLTDTATLTIDVNRAPTALSGVLSATEDGSAVVGQLSSIDLDSGEALTYSTENQPSEGSVTVNADGSYSFSPGSDFQDLAQGETRDVTFDYRVTDSQGDFSTSTVTVTVSGTNDAPALSSHPLLEDDSGAMRVYKNGELTGENLSGALIPDIVRTNNYVGKSNWGGDGSLDGSIDGSIDDLVILNEGLDASQAQALYLADSVDSLLDDGFHVVENSSNSTVVGSVASTDANTSDTATYSLTGDAGGRFSINSSTGEITVADSSQLDFEAGTSHDITVQVTDGTLSDTRTYTVYVTDANDLAESADNSVTTVEDSDYTFALSDFTFNDQDTGDSLSSVKVDSLPGDGTLTLNGSAVTAGQAISKADIESVLFKYEPADDLNGTDGNTACEGSQWLELDTDDTLDVLTYQTDTSDGQNLILQMAVKERRSDTSDDIEIYWDGELVTTIQPTSEWTLQRISLPAKNQATTALEIREPSGQNDFEGALLDDLKVLKVGLEDSTDPAYDYQITNLEDSAVPLNLSSTLGDSDGSESLSNILSGVPVGSTLTDGTFTEYNTDGSDIDVTWWNLSALSLTPPADGDTDFTLTLTSTSTEQSNNDTTTSSTTVRVDLLPVNDTPEIANAIANQFVDEDQPLSFQVPANTFSDAETGVNDLVYTASLADGSDLPGWLGFDETTRTFSGTPDNEDVTTLNLKVRATDPEGEFVEASFNLLVNNVNDSPVPVFQETGGLVAIEAEHYHSNVSRSSKTWVTGSEGGASGGESVSVADVNSGYSGSTEGNSPELTYEIQFDTAGTYYVWIKGSASGGSSDSIHVGLDGEYLQTSDAITGFNSGGNWSNNTMDSHAATITVDSAGVHQLNLWMREDGFKADKIILTTDSGYTPSGNGPAESEYVGITDQTTAEEAAFSYTIPAAAFVDPDGNTVTLSANLHDDSPLPAWLSFNPTTRTFSGTPDDPDLGTLTVKITATDGTGDTEVFFGLNVTAVDDAPVANDIDLGSVVEDHAFTITEAALLAGASDVDGDSLSVTSVSVDNAAHGAVVDNGDNTWTFIPTENFNGNDVAFSLMDFENDGLAAGWSSENTPEINQASVYSVTDSGGSSTGYIMDLDDNEGSAASNLNAVRYTVDTSSGFDHEVTFKVRARPDGDDTNEMEVVWNGQVLQTIDPTSSWETVTIRLPADGTDNAVLELRKLVGQNDDYGPLLDDITINKLNAITVEEDTDFDFSLSASLADTDGSETLAVSLSGIPSGYTLGDGTNSALSSGAAIDVTSWNLGQLSLSPAVNADSDFTITVTATATESSGGDTETTIQTITVNTLAVGDAPDAGNVDLGSVLEDNTFTISEA